MCPNQTANRQLASSGETRDTIRYDFDRIQSDLTSLSDTLGRKWTLVIVDRLLRDGPLGFSDLLDDIDGISSKVLSESLDDLEDAGFVDRAIVSERPFRVEYSLTQQGGTLESIIDKVRSGNLTVA